jgi:hypothetical protein
MAARHHLGPQFRTMYHGTSSSAWEEIQQSGLHPSVLGDTVTERPNVARSFSNDWDNPEMGDKPTVIRADIPSRVFHGYVDVKAGGPNNIDRSHPLRRTIPPKYLKEA